MDCVVKQLSVYPFNRPVNLLLIDSQRNSHKVPWIQLAELPRHETPQASPSTTASPLRSIGDTALFCLFPPIPQAPENFFGRGADLEDLLGFAERFASVTLFGPGGIGKTAIALTLLHHGQIATRFGRHRYFVRCNGLGDSLDGFLDRLSETTGAQHPTDMAQLRSHLEASPPCILVLDGIDSVLDPRAPGAVEIAAAIEEFGRCPKVCVLATSRMDIKIPHFRYMEVPTLPIEVAREVFRSRCNLGRSATVDSLLTELDFHPLSVTLLADAVRNNKWNEPVSLEEWEGGTMGILETLNVRHGLEDTIESVLRTPTIQELEPSARKTLEAIAAFPGGVKDARLEIMCPGISRVWEAVNALCKFSLMYREDGFVKMLSPFRLYFIKSTPTAIYHPGSDPAHSTTVEGIQYIGQDSPNPGPSHSLCPPIVIIGCQFLKVLRLPKEPEWREANRTDLGTGTQ